MKNITAADTLSMIIEERIQLVGDIWDTIAAKPEAVQLTDEEKRILDERIEACHKNPNAGSPWDDVFKRITELQ